MKHRIFGSLAVGLVATLALGTLAVAEDAGTQPAAKDIVDTAVAAGQFNTLVAAVQAADLVEVLKSEGPFTVFAPTDEAFAKLPAGTVEALLLPENKDKLVAILTYHVVPGKVMAGDAIKLDGQKVKTVQGEKIGISVVDGKVMINDSTVVAADVEASNGVIHVIDTVLLPPDPSAMKENSADSRIRHAIRLGVPLYNNHQPAACAAVYEVALRGLMADNGLDTKMYQLARMGLEKGMRTHDASDRAWAYRRSLDRMLQSGSPMAMRDAS